MFFIYNLLGNIILLLSPAIIAYRCMTGKEDPKRFTERYCKYKEAQNKAPLVWIHTASVGEMMSIIPILKKLESNKKIKKILLTSTTTSSANIFLKFKFKKTIHKYFPIDTDLFSNKFINFWNPKIAIFVESEVWPNMIKNLKLKKIPIILINARITKKSFDKWIKLKKFSKSIFGKINLALPQNKETSKYLKSLGVRNVRFCGNLKYYDNKYKKDKKNFTNSKLKNYKVWCAASTHHNEEIIIGNIHKKLKRKIKNILTIIIPRHIKRTKSIENQLREIDLKVQTHSQDKKIKDKMDIYLVDSFGINKSFYQLSNITFMGGSLIPHGGQNPLEPARLSNFIIHGAYIKNFKEVYSYLKKQKISLMTNSSLDIEKIVYEKINKRVSISKINKINDLGDKVLKKNLSELDNYIK